MNSSSRSASTSRPRSESAPADRHRSIDAACRQRWDVLLLRATLDGDRGAALRFFKRFNDVVDLSVRTVYRRAHLSPNEDELRDAINDVWLALLDHDMRSLRRFEPERDIQVTTWIAVLARNKTIDRLRTRRDRYVLCEGADQLAERAGSAPSPNDQLEAQERSDIVARAWRQLGPADQRFLEAWYIEDREPAELADEFGIAVGTVYSRRFKIQEKLARLVDRLYRTRPAATIPLHTMH